METSKIIAAVESHSFDTSTEKYLQEGLAVLFKNLGIPFAREVQLTKTDRIDFLIGNLGVEAKIKGRKTAVLRQLHRYAQHESIHELLLITSRLQLANVPKQLNGKAVHIATLLAL
jgi:hypothetical protein